MIALRKRCNEEIIKLLINNKTDLNKKDKYGYTPLMRALEYKSNANVVKLLITNKTDINQKFENGDTPLILLFEKYSEKNIALILSFFNNNNKMFNAIRLFINDSNYNFFMEKVEIIELSKIDIYGWNLLNYLNWNQRNRNINYLLVFSS